MPKIEVWDKFPPGVRQHLIDRMRDRLISISDRNQLREWIETNPEVPEGDWFKDFGSFTICGHGGFSKDVLAERASCQGAKALNQVCGVEDVKTERSRLLEGFLRVRAR